MDDNDKLVRAITLSLMDSNHDDQFQQDLQHAIEDLRLGSSTPRQSSTESGSSQPKVNIRAPSLEAQTGTTVVQNSFLIERAQLERKWLAQLKRPHTSNSVNNQKATAAAKPAVNTHPMVDQLLWDGELRPAANLHSMPRQDGKPMFRLTEVLSPKLQIMFAIISLYSTSVSWIYKFFDPCMPVIMVAQPDSSGQAHIKNILPNWVMTVPFLCNGHGCQHMKVCFLRYVNSNLIDYDWRDIENAVWLQGIPPHPQPSPHDPKITDDFPSIMQHVLHAVNVRDALTNMLAHEHPNLPLQLISDLCSKWDWSKVKVKLIPSIAGKHEGWPRVMQSGHPRLMKALRDFGLRTGKGKAAKELAIECQPKTRWTKLPWPPVMILFLSLQLFYDSNSAGGKVLMHTKVCNSNAVPITISDSKTESESEDDSGGVDALPKEPIRWAYVGSHNFTLSAWGTLSGSRFNLVLSV
ncbi:hypothetical protein EDC04DRAFT_2939418 [Pisolithus marmoratus]|nr:hypothetical protein EDC04DRAFT_2939418 [Pisolithus marmoratus]